MAREQSTPSGPKAIVTGSNESIGSIGRRIDKPESTRADSSLQNLQHRLGYAERTGWDIVLDPGVEETDGQRGGEGCSGSLTSARSPPRTTVSTIEKDASLIDRRVTRSQTRFQLSIGKPILSPLLQRLPSPTRSPPNGSDGSTLFVGRASTEPPTVNLKEFGDLKDPNRCSIQPLDATKLYNVIIEGRDDTSSLSSIDELWPEKTLVEPESEDEDEDEQEPDVSEYEEDPKKTAKERCRGRVINEANERTAAAWIEEHMLEETVCERCLAGEGHSNADDLSLEEMAEFFCSLGLPDSMRESKRTPLPLTSEDLLWKKVLTDRDCPRRINIGKSH